MGNTKYLPPLIESLGGSWKIGNVISNAQLSSLSKGGKYLKRTLKSTHAFFLVLSLYLLKYLCFNQAPLVNGHFERPRSLYFFVPYAKCTHIHYFQINVLECTQNLNISYAAMMMLDPMDACVSDLGQL